MQLINKSRAKIDDVKQEKKIMHCTLTCYFVVF